jgi:hypothetical protein
MRHETQAILELSKGKLTTDPDRHSGQGIFFTSRMLDEFSILSRGAYFSLEVTQPRAAGRAAAAIASNARKGHEDLGQDPVGRRKRLPHKRRAEYHSAAD